MANTVSAAFSLKLKVTETIDVDSGNSEFTLVSTNPTIDHEITTASAGTLTASTTPAVSKVWSGVSALTAGAETLDFTSLTGQSGTSVDFTNLKIQLLKIYNAGDNSMTFAVGASNGLDFFGDASGQITLPSGATVMLYAPEGLEDVDATHKTIDVTGTTTQSFHMLVVAG